MVFVCKVEYNVSNLLDCIWHRLIILIIILVSVIILYMDYDKLCKDVLSLAPDIRFAGVCDETGEIKYGGHREDVTNLLSSEETKRSNLQALARWGLRNSLASKIGRGKYAMAEYEKIKRITFPLENHHLLLITTEIGADHTKVIDGVLQLLGR